MYQTGGNYKLRDRLCYGEIQCKRGADSSLNTQ